MRCRRLLLLIAAFSGTAPMARAQILIGPGYGYSGYASRFGPSGGYRLGFGFGGSSFAPYGSYSSRVTIVTIVRPTVIADPRIGRSRPVLDEPPGELPDIPVERVRRPKPLPPPVPEPKKPAPVDEFARQIGLGKAAFEAEEYGRAVQRFREANRLRPDVPLPYFLLAQSLIAVGKYHDALDAILAGMARKPDWPTAAHQPIDLYGRNVAEYPEHLLRLDDALKRHPGDAVLSFLNGYEVWFAGRHDAARPLFRQARDRLAGKPGVDAVRTACERFLAS